MILVYAILFISFEAITEGLILRFFPKLSEIVFIKWNQILSSIILFAIWFILMLGFDKYYVPIWKLILGFIFVRFMIFDNIFNVSAGLPFFYYGTVKWYDQFMTKLVSWGWWLKFVLGCVGISFLI